MRDFKKHFGFELVSCDFIEVRYEAGRSPMSKRRIRIEAKGIYINCDEHQFNFYLNNDIGNWPYFRGYLGSSAYVWIEKLS